MEIFRKAGEPDEEEFGSGGIVLLEVTGGRNPSVIARGLVETMEEAPSSTALIKRAKKLPNSSTFIAYELPLEEIDLECGEVVFEAHPESEPIGPHPVFSHSSMRWTNGRRP